MIKRPTKSEIRASLDNQVEEFLNKGGEIAKFDAGDSSLIDGKYNRNQFVYGVPKQERTPVADTLNVIDQRKSQKTATTNRRTRRVRKVILDDFGEPLREVWVEE